MGIVASWVVLLACSSLEPVTVAAQGEGHAMGRQWTLENDVLRASLSIDGALSLHDKCADAHVFCLPLRQPFTEPSTQYNRDIRPYANEFFG